MSEADTLALSRPDPTPILTERPRPGESRPRLFVAWHPCCPQVPMYVYFMRQDYQPKWGVPGPPLQWACQALGPPQLYNGSSGRAPSSYGVLSRLYRMDGFAGNIAPHVKLSNLPSKEIEPYLADVLRGLYYEQDVIKMPTALHPSQPAQKDEAKGSATNDDEESLPSEKGRRTSKATKVRGGESEMSQQVSRHSDVANSGSRLADNKRKNLTSNSQYQTDKPTSKKRRST